MEQTIPHKSVRFFPHWDTYNPNHVIGFLNLINYILEKKTSIENWVELGSYVGESANLVLGFPSIKHIDCVDICKNMIPHINFRLNAYIKNNKCSVHHKSSYDFLTTISNNYMDVIYIDANHEYDFVKQDIELSFEKLKNNSFLSGHDYSPEYKSFPGSNQAIEEFSKVKGLEIVRFIDNSWLMYKE